MPKSTSKPIFVSHAVADRAIADKVVDLLSLGMGLDAHKQVFCSSLESLGIPPGQDFKQFIKEQIQEPKIVFLLTSQNYLASPFCLAEVGASWAMSHAIVPLLIPPLKFADMKAVLAGTQAGSIDDVSFWNEVLDVMKEALGIDPPTNRWNRKRDEKITEIKKLISKQPPVPTVPRAKFEELEKQLEEANDEIGDLENEIARLNGLVAKIKNAKDAKDVSRIELDGMPEAEAFDALMKAAKERMGPLPTVVCEALYYHFRNEPLEWPKYNSDDKTDDIQRAVEKKFLQDDEERGLWVNEEDPKVGRAISALRDVEHFIDKHPDFAAAYEEEHDHQLMFSSRQFWDAHLL